MSRNRFWLIKSEPSVYSFTNLQNEQGQTAEWDGVRNYQARNILRDEMKVDDSVLFYHSNTTNPAVVGTAIVTREGYPDYTAWHPNSDHPDPKSTPDKPIWYMVDIMAVSSFNKHVTLSAIKSTPALKNMVLVNNSRLSVQPVTYQEWHTITNLGTTD